VLAAPAGAQPDPRLDLSRGGVEIRDGEDDVVDGEQHEPERSRGRARSRPVYDGAVFGLGRRSRSDGAELDARARARLDRFAALFDTIEATSFQRFVGPEQPDAELREAMTTADRELGVERRREAVKRAVEAFVDAAQQRYTEAFEPMAILGLRPVVNDTSIDRARVFQSLERAIAALVLWDHLDEDVRVTLAGPWLDLVDRTVEPG